MRPFPKHLLASAALTGTALASWIGLPTAAAAPAAPGFAAAPSSASLAAEGADSLWTVPVTRTNARGLAMGDAMLADDLTIGSILSNPASLGLLRQDRSWSAGSTHDGRQNRMGHRMVAPLLRDRVHRLAVSASREHRGDRRLSLRSDSPYRPPDWTLTDASLFYALTIDQRFSLAVEQRMHHASADLGDIWTGTTRIGAFYRPDPSITYGFILDGFGRTPTVRLGKDGRTRTASSAPGESIEIGSTFRYPFEFRPTRMVLSLASRKDFDQRGILYKAGLEFMATPWLALRGGFLLRSYSDQDGPRAGLGLRGRHVWIDYGVAYSERREEYLHTLSLTLPFRPSPRSW